MACSSSKPFYYGEEKDWTERQVPEKDLAETIYLIGDAGRPSSNPLEPSLALLRQKLVSGNQSETSVVFLGDNIYAQGLHKKNHPDREQDELRIKTQLDILNGFSGNAIFIPGNHDWKQGKPKGDHYVKRQERFIEKYLNRGNTFLPDNGCPGPEEILLDEKLLLVVLDTQWWLHAYDKSKGEGDGCEADDEGTFILQLKDIFRKNQDKQIVVVGHHPLYSNGNHGGYYTFKDHLFPLTAVKKNLYIPLPIIGSIYPLYRGLLGNIQDIPHYKYQALIKSLTTIFDEFDDVVYVSGHEHNLQYQKQNNTHYVVSGAGSKASYVRHNADLSFGQECKGFAALKYYEDGDLWVEFYSPESENKTIYRKQLREGKREQILPTESVLTLNLTDSIVTVVPGGQYYEAGPVKRAIFGDLYRDVWTTPIQVPVLDLASEHGGLIPIRRGGGMQSRSLRLKGGDGHQYVLRSIQKYPASVIPVDIRNTFVTDIVQDGIAASHPYAAIIVPTMAEVAGVNHTNPKLVFVPDVPALGEYRQEFGGVLCLYEERPYGNMKDVDGFGGAKKIIGTPDLIEKLREDYREQVDQKALLRARLFDIVIGDWDRHDDQWRWASYKKGKGHIYRPIPRDRDQVFYKMDGLVPRIVNQPWAARLFEPFESNVKDFTSLNYNARHLDRAYLTMLSREEWNAIADTLQGLLTDEVFEEALALFPDSIKPLQNERLFRTLQRRRDDIVESANEYYSILAETVDIVGTEMNEFFEVERIDDEQTSVTIYPSKKGKKNPKKVIYHRVFKTSETKEIRLYGIEGKDVFSISGNTKKGILVRLVGGPDVDTYIDSSHVAGLRKHTEIYDRKEKKKKNRDIYQLGKETKTILVKNEEDAVTYERKAFAYDVTRPIVYLGFNPDDGVYLGAGFIYTKHGFNKKPFKYTHRVKGNYAIATGAFNFQHQARYNSIFNSKWDFESDLVLAAPDYLFSFYGLGNESEPITGDWRDNRLRMNFFNVFAGFSRKSEGDVHNFTIGPNFLYVNPPFDVFDGDFEVPDEFLDEFNFGDRWYGGVRGKYELTNVDNKFNPHRGIRFLAEASWTKAITNSNADFIKLKSEVKFYLPFTWLPTKATLAIRSGIAANIGTYDFYQANYLSGYSEMRGLRRNRFGGDVSFYNNLDLRIKLFDLDNYVLPFEIGVLGFGDIGRVWVENQSSELWHWAAGAGMYFSPLNALVINASYGVSDDAKVFTLLFGFLF